MKKCNIEHLFKIINGMKTGAQPGSLKLSLIVSIYVISRAYFKEEKLLERKTVRNNYIKGAPG